MALSNLRPVVCWIPPVTGPTGSHAKASKVEVLNRRVFPALQVQAPVKVKEESLLLHETASGSSRRELMQMTAASIGLLLLLPASAEARPRNAAARQKILRKLEELRQKQAGTKSKIEEESIKKQQNQDSQNGESAKPELPFIVLPSILNG
ncbi:uncharacterized protein LOC127260859 isoform X1 [Andrographis paniculata]|uniref:uncharacterized protein LOC127260859 isoform X1 n=1 Tax=Andrographis paniculata TaxID=175694 RepID=UPI0021E7EC96|nr:uncharacterized protein LOC127260859 isoform X1 [Andrographis paniculata]